MERSTRPVPMLWLFAIIMRQHSCRSSLMRKRTTRRLSTLVQLEATARSWWDQRASFGDTLFAEAEEGGSLAEALGDHMMVMMNRHGVTVAGTNLCDLLSDACIPVETPNFKLKRHSMGKLTPSARATLC